jgi:hypothetical protein
MVASGNPAAARPTPVLPWKSEFLRISAPRGP